MYRDHPNATKKEKVRKLRQDIIAIEVSIDYLKKNKDKLVKELHNLLED